MNQLKGIQRRIERLQRVSCMHNPMPFLAVCENEQEYLDAKERAKAHDSRLPPVFVLLSSFKDDETS